MPSPRRHLRRVLLTGACVPLAGLAACGGGDEPEAAAKLPVAVTLAPVQEAVTRIGGDAVAVTNLTPVGGQPHDLEPSEPALAALRRAKVVVTVGPGFQPAVTEAVGELPASVERVDLLGGPDLLPAPEPIEGERGRVEGGVEDGDDPHLWGSPKRFITVVERLRDALAAAAPAQAAALRGRADAYLRELRALDRDYAATLTTCERRTLLTTHPAYGYLAADYDLEQAVTAGIGVSARPDPRSLRATARFAKAQDVTTLFFALPVPSRVAAGIERDTGLATASLNPVEGLTQDQIEGREGYVTLMRANLAALAEGLGCEAPAGGDGAAGTTPAASTPSATTTP